MNRSDIRAIVKTSSWALLLVVLFACNRSYVVTDAQYNQYQANKDSTRDATADRIIATYRDSLRVIMDEVIGQTAKTLNKARPESELGNFCADALAHFTRNTLKQNIDGCILNHGGMRLPYMTGTVTVGTVYELFPFDNTVVVMRLGGDSLQSACDAIARVDGFPVSGIRFVIRNNKAEQVTVNGLPLQRDSVYRIATVDYLANGGDNMTMLITAKQDQTGWLLRDALIHFIRNHEGPIDANLDHRIQHVEQ